MQIDEAKLRMEIGTRVAAARADASMTQEDLADAVNVSLTTINRLERGHTMPGLTLLFQICSTLSLPPSVLFDMPPWATERATEQRHLATALRQAPEHSFRLASHIIRLLLGASEKRKKSR